MEFKWNKTNIHHTMRMYNLLQDHIFDEFHDWWEKNMSPLGEYNSPEWKRFWDGMYTLNDNSFFDFDWRTKEWIILHGKDEYRFPQNWPYEGLNDEPDLEMVWHSGYYDGPLSGMCLLNGQYAWFDCFSDDWDEPYFGSRVYRVYQLSNEELNEEFYWHELFRKYVGHHTSYGANYAPCCTGEDHRKFYDAAKKRSKPDYSNNNILGEFTDVQFRRDRPLPPAEKEGKVVEE